MGTLNLFLNVSQLDRNQPLPERYLGVPQVQTTASGLGNAPCGRCGNGWGIHDWILYSKWQSPLDCSFRPRREAS